MSTIGKVYNRGLKKLKQSQVGVVHFDKSTTRKKLERFDDFDNI